MLYLYYNKKSDIDWDIFYQKIDYKIISFITLWTVGSFFDGFVRLFIMILTGIIIRFTRNFSIKSINLHNIGMIIIGFAITENIIWLSFMYHFGYYLIDNFFIRGIRKTVYNKVWLYVKSNYKEFLITIHQDYISFIKNIVISIAMKYLYINQLYNTLNLFTLCLTNINQCQLHKILFVLIYIAIINKKALFKIILLSYIGSVIIRVCKNRLVNLETGLVNLETGLVNLETGLVNLEINKLIDLEIKNQSLVEQEIKDAMIDE